MQELRTMGSVADMLMRFVSTTTVRDSNYEIALLMLKNYKKVRTMTQKQMAELCFVSEAAISRFCRFLGFENFRDFKTQMSEDFSVRDDYSRRIQRQMKNSSKDAAELLRNELHAAADSVNESMFYNAHMAADMIHNASYTAVFSHHFLWDTGRFLQSKLMMLGKYIDAHQDYDMQKADASLLGEKDLAVIITIGGSWFSRYTEIYNLIAKSSCSLIVVTQNLSSPYLNRADLVMQCGTSNVDDTGKYCALAAMDAIVLNYLKEYGD